MFKGKSVMCALLAALGLSLLISLPAATDVRSHQGQKDQTERQANTQPTGKDLDDAATPIVDFDVAHDGGPDGGNPRKLKNARFDKYGSVQGQPHAGAGESILFSHWQDGLSDIPVDRSSIVVEGKVIDSKAFLSNDKTGVYSEFTIRAGEIFKAPLELTIKEGDTLVAERYGGRVRYSSGKVMRYRMDGQGSPAKGKTYLFFLAGAEQDDYKILTAYELQGGQVFALDGKRVNRRGRGDWVFDKHNGKEPKSFLEEVRRAVGASPNTAKSQEVGWP